MKYINFNPIGILVIALFIFSCGKNTGKDLSSPVVLFAFFQLDDTTCYLKITNQTKKDIYLPEKYWANYTDNDDTIHLESFANPLYNTTYYYRYDHTLPFIFYTSKVFDDTKPDSIVKKTEPLYFNQFRVRPFKLLSADSTTYMTLNFLIPRLTPIVKIVYYEKSFFMDDLGKKVNYDINDFMSFESKNAKYVTSTVTLLYKDDQ